MLNYIDYFEPDKLLSEIEPEPVFEYGKFYSNDEVLDKLNEMYSSAGIIKKARISQLKQYYQAEKMIIIRDGRSISGFKVYESKKQQII